MNLFEEYRTHETFGKVYVNDNSFTEDGIVLKNSWDLVIRPLSIAYMITHRRIFYNTGKKNKCQENKARSELD